MDLEVESPADETPVDPAAVVEAGEQPKPSKRRTSKAAASKKRPAAPKKAASASDRNGKALAGPAESSDGVPLALLAAAVPLLTTFLGRPDQSPAQREHGPISSESLSDLTVATQRLGVDVTSWDFKQLSSFIQQAVQFQREQRAQEEEVAARQRQLDAQTSATENEYRLKTRETNVRFAIAMILILGAVVGVFAGIVSGMDASEVAQYIAPITGLAGIAVGYFFGRATQ